MSYSSQSIFPPSVTLNQVFDLVSLLGYRKILNDLNVPNLIESYFWFEETDYRSYVGIELNVYKKKNGRITITTRSRVGRSYWDLIQQNRTLKLFRDFLGGSFQTDAGKNRYWRPETKPPAPISSGFFLARWRFHNALIRAKIYIDFRGLEKHKQTPSGFENFDQMNPRLFSNNLVLPYLIAIWEDFFKSTFMAALKYASTREAALRKARFPQNHLEAIAAGNSSVEEAIANTLSFQRPSVISENFRLLDHKLDLAGAFKRPYNRRKTSLFDSIEILVEQRNDFVHEGQVNTRFSDQELRKTLSDLEVAIDRAYKLISNHYGLIPIEDFK